MVTAREKRTAKASTSVTVEESSKGTKTVVVKKTATTNEKEKRVYSLPGQKHEPPNERDALRVFYETLREQIPSSEMAELWLMEHGLLSADDAQKAFKKKQQGRLKVATPVKALPGKVKSELQGEELTSKPRRKLDRSSGSDDDFIANASKKSKGNLAEIADGKGRVVTSKKSKLKLESQEETEDGKKRVMSSKKSEVKLESQKETDYGNKTMMASKKSEVKLESQNDTGDGKRRVVLSKKSTTNFESQEVTSGKGTVKANVSKPQTASKGKRKVDSSDSDDDFIADRKPKVKKTA